MPSIRNS
jgi:hypothetical protein